MPYSGPDDASLPDRIKKLPANKRRQFVHVWNTTYNNCISGKTGGGPGTKKACEGLAFRFANAVVKEMDMPEEEKAGITTEEVDGLLEGVKEGRVISSSNMNLVRRALEALRALLEAAEPIQKEAEDKQMDQPTEAGVLLAKPLGGAQSFGDAEAYSEAQEQEGWIRWQTSTFRYLFDNIMSDEEKNLEAKASAVAKLAQELGDRIRNGPEGQRGLVDKVKVFLGIAGKAMVATHKSPESETKTWDGAAAVDRLKKWASSDGSGDKEKVNWAKFRTGFATYDPGNAKNFGGYHYPHHDIEGGKFVVVRAGVGAAYQRASQQKDTAAQGHLQPHREQFGFGQRMVGSFAAFKDLSGDWRWLSVTTNKFKDLEGEIFSDKAHEQYVAHADEHKEYPELWLWHVEEARIGQADYVAYNDDGFVLHSGVFDDGMEDVAERLSESKGLAVSHGYYYEPGDEEDGVYEWYRTFEVSVLPADRAANAYTDFAVESKEVDTMLTAEKRGFLVDKWGEPRTVELEEKLASLSGELKEAGIEFKDLVGETETSDPKPAEESKGDTEPAPEAPEPLTAEAVKAIVEEVVLPVKEAISEAVDPLKERLDSLERSDEEKILDRMSPRRKAPGDGERPSQSDATKVEGDEVAKIVNQPPVDPIQPYVDDLTKGRVTQTTGTIAPPQGAGE